MTQVSEAGSANASAAEIGYCDGDRIEGAISSAQLKPTSIRVECDGQYWATVRAVSDPNASETHRFSCDLPPIATTQSSDVKVLDAATGDVLASLKISDRKPKTNGYGLLATDVLALHTHPFFAVPWIRFNGAELVVSGAHLPPAGDPSSLKIKMPPGVAFETECGLPTPNFLNFYWYWPNAEYSGFTLKIDLAGSERGSDPFSFEFDYPLASPRFLRATERDQDASNNLHRRAWIANNLASFVGFPRDMSQLTRVQTWSNDLTVTVTGYNAFRTVEALLNKYGVRRVPGVCVMDWGCGHGRVTRHFIDYWPEATIVGSDIDPENTLWCREHLKGGTFVSLPLWPPCSIESGSLDAIFGISVMTHLTAKAQEEWLNEIARLLKPTGLALISFGGPGAVAFSSVFRDHTWWREWIETSFNDQLLDPALDGKISDATYYRQTLQTHDYTRETWSRKFEILEIIPDLLGNLDIAVMRLRS